MKLPKMQTVLSALALCLTFGSAPLANAAPQAIRFAQSAQAVEVYDFIEIVVDVDRPAVANPFTEVAVQGEFTAADGKPVTVDGFCDSDDGRLYRVRFMPSQPGRYSYTVHYRQGDTTASHSATFNAERSKRRGPVRVDRNHPFHFVWEGTGEHYFWNSTTTYALIGWRDDAIIRQSIDRLAKLKVNRLRVAIVPPRVKGGSQWFEPTVTNDSQFTFCVNAWPAARPDSVDNPGFDTSRFNLAHWQKYERLLRYARERDMIISVIFYVDGALPGVDPFRKEKMGGEDEQRYYRYAAARFAPFSNVMWDVANEYRFFRTDPWAEQTGAFLKQCDPYDHLTSIHGFDTFNFRKSLWADFAMYQCWDEHGGYAFMLKNRREQEKTGRPMPQVNEEYGYEDHYPQAWGENRKPPARSADNRRQLAWEMTMAGGYQTTGERANVSGHGGWINGRGNAEMVMLEGYAHIREFFERMPWWKLEPHPELVDSSALCLAEPGQRYVVYLPTGGTVKVKLGDGRFDAQGFNPRTGTFVKLPQPTGAEWESPAATPGQDWVLLLQRSE